MNIILIFGWGGSPYSWGKTVDVLHELGHKVCVPDIPPRGSLKARSRKLICEIKAFFPDGDPLHLIGHSMGGLNARDIADPSAVRKHGLNIKSVTTLATPHRGSHYATAANLLTAGYPHRFPFGAFNVNDFTFHTLGNFNNRIHNNKNVLYLSWAGMRDDVVSQYSACWGNFLGEVGSDDHKTLPRNVDIIIQTLPILQEACIHSPEFCAYGVREVQLRMQVKKCDDEDLRIVNRTLIMETRWRVASEVIDLVIKFVPGTKKLWLWHT